MKLLLELSMECESLASSEAVAACESLGSRAKIIDSEPGVIVLETGADSKALADRLGLCHYVDEWLFSCIPEDLESFAEDVEVEGPIRIRSTKIGELAIDLAAVSRKVGAIIGKSKGVDLHHPRSEVRVVFSKRVHVGRVISAIDRTSFEKRKNRYMPYFYPASLHPKFARAVVNLSRVRGGEPLLDPFCGTGAILAEAALVGVSPIGSDVSSKMIDGARENLRHLGLESQLHTCDVGEIRDVIGAVSGIATDPPYGKSTSTQGEKIPELYKRAFSAFSEVLRSGSVVAVVVPKMSLLERIGDFKVEEEHKLWVHRSLTRHFCVARRR